MQEDPPYPATLPLIRVASFCALLLSALSLSPFSPALAAQESAARRTIAGQVTQGGDVPVPFAVITATGATSPARVDSTGRFIIRVPAGDATLTVRAIGFAPQQVAVPAASDTVTVTLSPQPLKLGEIVITGEASTLARRTATTAGATVTAEEVTRAPAQSIEQALQGKVLGAAINMNSGAPGGGGQIQIRGATSILGNSQPLVVVDGTIISNDAFSSGANAVTRAGGGVGGSNQDNSVNRLADLDPNEIESIEVVKDAAATAIYGSRASNGVLVIRTKHGTPGKPRFTLTQRVGVSAPLRYLGYRTFRSVAEVEDLPSGQTSNSAAVAYLDARFPDGSIPASANVDLEREFFSNRDPGYETVATASGGSDQTRYFVSATNRHEEGVAPNTGAHLLSGRLNLDQSWSPRWRSSVNLGVLRNVLDRGLANNDNSFTSPVYAFAYTPAVFDLRRHDSTGLFVRNPIFGGGSAASNPFETYDNLTLTEDVFRQIGSATVSFTPLDRGSNRVVLALLGGFDRFEQSGKLVSPGFVQYEGRDGFLGRAQQSTTDALNQNLQGTVTWTAAPSPTVSFTTAIGGSIERQATNRYAILGRGLLPGTDIASQGNISTFQERTEFRDQALFASEQLLALDERLILSAGIRADRSSANGDQAHFYVFPRASGAYRFVQPLPGLDEIKVRAGWGQTGNRPRYGDRDILLSQGSLIDGQPGTVNRTTVGNSHVEPETLTEVTAGVDVSALDHRILLEATTYTRTITDLLLQPAAAPSTGFSNYIINAGKLRNRGVELGITGVPVSNDDFTVTSHLAFQRSRERVVDLPPSVPPFAAPNSFGASFGRNRVTAGYLSSAIWGNVPVDVEGNVLPVGAYVTHPELVAGRADTVIGDANPDFRLAFDNSIRWRSFTLAFTIDWRHGGDVANTTTKLYDEGGTSRDFTAPITSADALRGLPAGDISRIPASILGLGDFRYQAWHGGSDARVYLQDGSAVRLRDVSIGYELPSRIASALRADFVRVNLQGRNLLMSSDYWGYDPEFNNFGNQNLNRFIDTAPFPSVRSVYLSIDLGF